MKAHSESMSLQMPSDLAWIWLPAQFAEIFPEIPAEEGTSSLGFLVLSSQARNKAYSWVTLSYEMF